MYYIASVISTLFVTFSHVYIVWLEMFAWETAGKRAFRGSMASDMFPKTKNMAANQGLYNGFLVAGLTWSFLISDAVWSVYVRQFFLGCVAVAGIYGGYSISRKVFYIQAVPAIIALALVTMA